MTHAGQRKLGATGAVEMRPDGTAHTWDYSPVLGTRNESPHNQFVFPVAKIGSAGPGDGAADLASAIQPTMMFVALSVSRDRQPIAGDGHAPRTTMKP